MSISSNYTNTDFNLKLIINGNKQCIRIKELFEGLVGDSCIARNTAELRYVEVLRSSAVYQQAFDIIAGNTVVPSKSF